MSEKKKTNAENAPKSTELAVAKNKILPKKKLVKKPTEITKSRTKELGQAFDETFDRFRNDFEDLLFPISDVLSNIPEIRVPVVDLEDREKDYLLKAEMPGFKKEDIEINVQEDGVEITGVSGWKYSEKDQAYICKERACKSFYRYVDLPENIKLEDVNANLCDGVLEISLPKKAPKQKRKVQVK